MFPFGGALATLRHCLQVAIVFVSGTSTCDVQLQIYKWFEDKNGIFKNCVCRGRSTHHRIEVDVQEQFKGIN